MKRAKKRKVEDYPSLYDAFNLGDRVKRIYKDKTGNPQEYRGVVLAIDNTSLEIYWDTKDGKYRPGDMDVAFTTCPLNEIFNGNEHYTPITKDDH
jgi:hypothetical protein